MGFKVGKALKKAVKAVTKPAVNSVKSTVKAVENGVSAVKHLATGDISGAISKVGNVVENVGNISSYGTVDLTGRKDGIINIDADKYTDAAYGVVKDVADSAYGAVKSLVGANKEKTESTPTQSTTDDWDGLSAYVADLRARKRRRSRAGTNNTTSTASTDTNKLSGTTVLGV